MLDEDKTLDMQWVVLVVQDEDNIPSKWRVGKVSELELAKGSWHILQGDAELAVQMRDKGLATQEDDKDMQ